ncbi:MAG: hypothetical protein M0Q49_05370 [Porticoccaceae bacterium]|nr:hypothetical protein [Porticoccaceae bacterium]
MTYLQRVRALISGSRRLRLVLLLGLMVVLLVLAYLAGSHHFSANVATYRAEREELLATREELDRLRQELVNREVAVQVDSASLETMRQLVADLQAQLARREEDLGLYRSLMDDQDGSPGLQVDSLTLRQAPEADSFHYRIVVRRRADPNESVDVSVSLAIDGLRDGEPVSVPFNEADLSLQEDALSIRFKYFKVLRGTFVLPADFVPAKVVLTVMEKNDPGTLRIVDFPWELSP